MSRREGYALHPKAHKALVKRSALPGQKTNTRQFHSRGSQYQIQLREKQKVKRLYGLLEKQFAKLMKESIRTKGQSGENLLIFLEQRLDNTVYRAGLAASRKASRQLVSHGHFMLNGRRVNIPSIRVKKGDKIVLRDHSKINNYFKNIDELAPIPTEIPAWLKVNRKKFEIDVVSDPIRDNAELDIKEQLIVEYYSR